MIATCHTAECGNLGAPIDVGDLTYTDDDGNEHTMPVQCGVCGQPITDLGDHEQGHEQGGPDLSPA